jgi:zinc protease
MELMRAITGRRVLAWLAAALAAAAFPAHALLPIQYWQTSSGARVLFVESRGLPMLDLSVHFPAGASYDRAETSGVASMTNHVLQLGADGMSEEEIAQRLADVGAQLAGRFSVDHAGLSVRTLVSAKERGQALDTFTRILTRPEFPREALEREKVRLIGSLKEADTRPETIASRNFYRMVYRDHPYSLRSSGEVATVGKITRDQLAEFHKSHYVAQHAVVALIGDVSRAEAEAIAEQVTRNLPRSSSGEPPLPPVPDLAAPASRVITHPASQAHILIGAPGITRNDPDYFPLFVGNYVLGGGGFVSRITEEVRQKRGLAYSAYSYFSPLRQQGPFLIGMQTQREQAQGALKVVRDVVRDFVASGPTEDELKAAKQNIIGGFPLRIDSNAKIHEYLALIGAYRLPLTYLDDFVKKVDEVTVAQVKDAFARRVHPDRLVTVVVAGEDAK